MSDDTDFETSIKEQVKGSMKFLAMNALLKEDVIQDSDICITYIKGKFEGDSGEFTKRDMSDKTTARDYEVVKYEKLMQSCEKEESDDDEKDDLFLKNRLHDLILMKIVIVASVFFNFDVSEIRTVSKDTGSMKGMMLKTQTDMIA